MLVSSSEGFLRDSLFGAILLRALMIAVVGDCREGRESRKDESSKWESLEVSLNFRKSVVPWLRPIRD